MWIFGLYEDLKANAPEILKAVQNSCDVMATSTYYNFTCGPVDLV